MTPKSPYNAIQASSLSLYRDFLRSLRSKPAEHRETFRRFIRADFERCHQTIPRTAIAAAEYKLRAGRKKLEMMQMSGTTGMQTMHVPQTKL